MKKNEIKLFGVFFISLFLAIAFNNFGEKNKLEKITFSEFNELIEQSKVNKVSIKNQKIIINDELETPRTLINNIESDLIEKLKENNVKIEFLREEPSILITIFNILLPFILLYLVYSLIMKKNQPQNILDKKSNVNVINPENINTSFSDIAGIDEIKYDVLEIVDFMREPQKYWEIGSNLPKGVLLSGPPGTGKTLLAKAMAKESGCNFISTSGSEFVEMFVGMGAKRVRDLFATARTMKPCVIFIDEIDAVGKSRGGVGGNTNDEREQTLNQLLVEMDGLDSSKNHGIVVMAATNRPEILDSALKRPGRFDRLISISLPNIDSREEILKVHARNKKIENNVSLRDIAKGTSGFSGADLENLLNESALISARKGFNNIKKETIEEAKDKIVMGAPNSKNLMSEYEKKLTAYHEAGHAILGYLLDEHDPVHKVSIVPRSRSLGVTMFLPEKDSVSLSKTKSLSMIKTLYGGRIAEEVFFGENSVTTGASNDIERATSLARKMVKEWGLSSLGPIHIDDKINNYGEKTTYSELFLRKIDKEIEKILNDCYVHAKEIILTNKDKIEIMVDKLLEKETIDKDDINKIMES